MIIRDDKGRVVFAADTSRDKWRDNNRRPSPYHSHFDSAMGVLIFLAAIAVILACIK